MSGPACAAGAMWERRQNERESMSCAMAPRPYGLEAPVTLSEVLDRVCNTGVVMAGEIVISVAGIDLLYLGLNLMLSSVETLRPNGPSGAWQ
jgi:gas vesicle structural protein